MKTIKDFFAIVCILYLIAYIVALLSLSGVLTYYNYIMLVISVIYLFSYGMNNRDNL